uniref:(northern house mosquito) hypothetical protein n=1 Tax=Culex pipiens TaxID=7175 RepID=A0A8D8FI45_CULPI
MLWIMSLFNLMTRKLLIPIKRILWKKPTRLLKQDLIKHRSLKTTLQKLTIDKSIRFPIRSPQILLNNLPNRRTMNLSSQMISTVQLKIMRTMQPSRLLNHNPVKYRRLQILLQKLNIKKSIQFLIRQPQIMLNNLRTKNLPNPMTSTVLLKILKKLHLIKYRRLKTLLHLQIFKSKLFYPQKLKRRKITISIKLPFRLPPVPLNDQRNSNRQAKNLRPTKPARRSWTLPNLA